MFPCWCDQGLETNKSKHGPKDVEPSGIGKVYWAYKWPTPLVNSDNVTNLRWTLWRKKRAPGERYHFLWRTFVGKDSPWPILSPHEIDCGSLHIYTYSLVRSHYRSTHSRIRLDTWSNKRHCGCHPCFLCSLEINLLRGILTTKSVRFGRSMFVDLDLFRIASTSHLLTECTELV